MPLSSRHITLFLPGGPYRIRGLDNTQYNAVAERYFAFLSSSHLNRKPIDVQIISTEPLRSPLSNPPFRQITYLHDKVFIQSSYFYGTIRLNPCLSATIFVHLPTSAHPSYFTRSVFHYFMRALTAYSLAVAGGVLLHSSCVIINHSAQCFVGPSGAGKSTIASLFQKKGYKVLSDDLNCILPSTSGPFASPLPFAGDIESHEPSHHSRFRGLFSLKKSQSNAVTPRTLSRILPLAIANSPIINIDPYRLQMLLNNLLNLLRQDATLGQVQFAKETCPDQPLIQYLSR